MRFMVILKSTPESEKEGFLPDQQLMADMGKFNEELIMAGGLLKNTLFMQIYADVMRRPLCVLGSHSPEKHRRVRP